MHSFNIHSFIHTLIYTFNSFIHSIIDIPGERHVPGVGDVTEDQMVRKEIIQLLCVEPMSNSALNKAGVNIHTMYSMSIVSY